MGLRRLSYFFWFGQIKIKLCNIGVKCGLITSYHFGLQTGMDQLGLNTRSIWAGADPEQWKDWDFMPPVSHTTIYKQVGPGKFKRFDYSRCGNPTRQVLQDALADLENGKNSLVFSSGSAATVAAVHLLSAGDHIIGMDDLYTGTLVYLTQVASRMNISTTFVDGTNVSNFLSAIKTNTKLIWLETTSNPKLQMPDIQEIAKQVHDKNKDILVLVDNTFITPCIVRPLDLGADISLMSCSKYINGHHDVIMGSLTTKRPDLHQRLKFLQESLGAVPPASDCYQIMRSLKTLPLRMERHHKNGLALAQFLESDPRVEKVNHPLLASHAQNQLALTQNKGRHSGMISCLLKGTAENVHIFATSIKVCLLATSLGGVITNIAIPGSMTGVGLDDEFKAKRNLGTNFLRISVGLEDIEDIIADIKQALDKAYL